MWICTILVCTITFLKHLILCKKMYPRIMSLFIGKHIGGCCCLSAVKVLDSMMGMKWCTDAIGEWTVEMLQRCSFTSGTWSSVQFVSAPPTMIKRAGHRGGVGVRQTRLAARPRATYCTADLDLLFPLCLLCQKRQVTVLWFLTGCCSVLHCRKKKKVKWFCLKCSNNIWDFKKNVSSVVSLAIGTLSTWV